MTGGLAFVYDPEDTLPLQINDATVIFQRIETDYYDELVRELIGEHAKETQSSFAQRLLIDWHKERSRFWLVIPKEMIGRLAHPITTDETAASIPA